VRVEDDELHSMAEACIELHTLVMQSGSPMMKILSQALLFEIGREIASQTSEDRSQPTATEASQKTTYPRRMQ
jgi:hypothetical protein